MNSVHANRIKQGYTCGGRDEDERIRNGKPDALEVHWGIVETQRND